VESKVVKIEYRRIILFIIVISLILCLNSCFAAIEGNSNTTKSFDPKETAAEPYITPITSWYHTLPPIWTGFIVGYYINPSKTPISEINFTALKNSGITDIYVLVTNDNYSPVLSESKTKADAVGIRTNAWVFPGFNYASQVAQMKIGVLLDVETYDMPAYISQIKDMRQATPGVTFSLCVKPDKWDGNQYYDLIAPLCDHIVPILYIGDYGKGITGLTNWAKNYSIYNVIYPGKIIAGIETYENDENTTPKSASTVLAEIKAVQPHTKGVILFRYGLSNFNG
jgi:hypothetical protein